MSINGIAMLKKKKKEKMKEDRKSTWYGINGMTMVKNEKVHVLRNLVLFPRNKQDMDHKHTESLDSP